MYRMLSDVAVPLLVRASMLPQDAVGGLFSLARHLVALRAGGRARFAEDARAESNSRS